MFNFKFNFKPIDPTPVYKRAVQYYKWGWTSKEKLAERVSNGTLPESYYEEATGEKYEKDKEATAQAN